ncbi:MAG: NHLP bacteriocin export ABC transporter permease/ATPase subunit [Cyanobacteriota bacterium]|nr:NHLP bacteriocin export ABC transporter permease/ATPase subunit [Cyanobacteriota bacterium]
MNQELNRQKTQEALIELASVLQPEFSQIPQTGTPLLIAFGIVARALGITVNYTPKIETEETEAGWEDPIEAIASASHIRTRRVTLTNKWWQQDCGPLLAYNEAKNRPVALLKTTNYEIFDPIELTRIPLNQTTAQELASIAYTFYRPFPNRDILAFDIFKLAFRGRLKDLLIVATTGIIATLLGMLTPVATGIIIDNAIPDANEKLLIEIGLGLLAASFGVSIFQLTRGFVTLRLKTISSSTIQAAIWDRLLKLTPAFFREYSTGDLENRVSAISQIRDRLTSTILTTIFTSFFSLLNLVLLFIYSFPLALIAFAVACLTSIVTVWSGAIARKKLRSFQERSGEIFGLTVQLIGGVSKLRVAGAEERAFAYWAKKYSQQARLMLGNQLIEDLVTAFNTALPTVSSILLFTLTVYLIQTQETDLSVGKFLAFNTAFGTFISGATNLSKTIVSILEIVILWERAQPILAAKPEVDINKSDPGQLSGRIKLDRLSFRYRPDSPLVVDDITIEAEAEEFIALVGPSGSGKSTIVRLLLGFETPAAGTIYYDGRDLSTLDVSRVRRQLGVVLQNVRLNSASIFENIACGALVTVDDAWEAAEMAGFADDIEEMPMEMNTIVSEGGGNLSGGQRQRLLIARALVLKPRILIFDEATSALDNRTQAIVTESLEELGVTRIVIAHRLSTIRNANRIYVLQGGKIIQHGSFEELASQDGLFANLMARQM